MNSLKADLPLPPSMNNLYFNHPKGGRRMSTEGVAYKNRVKALIVATTDVLEGEEWDPNVMYRLEITFYFRSVENKGWYEKWARDSKPGAKKPHRKGERKALSRWKKRDTGNFEKVIGDALKDLLGVDDCANFVIHLEKYADPERPRAEVYLRELPED